MARVYSSTIVNAAPEKVWALVRDFNALPKWFPFIAASRLNDGDVPAMVGAERTLQARNGGVVRERLLELSDTEMRLSFLTFEGADLTLNYTGHMRVRPIVRGGGSFFEFYGVFDAAEGDVEKASSWLRNVIFEPVFAQFEALFGRKGE
jgi:uncharacterized protein YndB with AHSA1/START domain